MATIYYVINTSLKMGAGKIAAQCCHVNTEIIREMEKNTKLPRIYREWKLYGETTIILAADEQQFNAIFEEFKNSKEPIMKYVVDAGRTEVKPGTITVLGFMPVRKENAPDCIKNLKCL